jgi:peptidoglycan/LPS O-acetylase OafA/YrhL
MLFIGLLGPTFLGVLLFVQGGHSPIVSVLEWGPFRYIGRISYGLYLYHLPIFYFYHSLIGVRAPALGSLFNNLASAAIAVAVAAASYRFIEKPLLSRRGWGSVRESEAAITVTAAE